MIEAFTTPKGIRFELSYIDKPEDMAGRMQPFRPVWYAQHLSDGLSNWFDTKEAAMEWMNEWDEITD